MVRMVSSGLETFGCSRIAPSEAAVASDNVASVAPARSAASVMRLRSAPELDITAMFRPRGNGWRARNSTASMASSNDPKRMTPALPATASNASALPASEPVCASAAARDVSDAPTFTATTALPLARARRTASRKCAVSGTPSM
jgi:hypothetical protein